MQVILLERIGRLGQMGDVVNVKDGYARNFLLPQKKALRATPDNLKRFEKDRAQLEARNLELKKEAEAVASQARRQDLPRHPPGRRHRPALRLGHAARHRRAGDGGRLLRRQAPDRARPADQDARAAADPGRAPSRGGRAGIAQHRPLRGRGRAPGPRRGRDGGEGGGRAARDLQSRRRVRGGGAVAASAARRSSPRCPRRADVRAASTEPIRSAAGDHPAADCYSARP